MVGLSTRLQVVRSTLLGFDHALECTKLPMCFGGRSKPMVQSRFDRDKLSDPTCLSIFRSELAENLVLAPSQNINEHGSFVKNAVHFAGLVS